MKLTDVRYADDLPRRFWEKVHRRGPDDCWFFSHDAGELTLVDERVGRRRHIRCNRVAYMLTHGEVPDDMVVLHSGDRILCTNPEHLSLGTQKENMRQRSERGRHPRGAAKLTYDQVAEIRQRAVQGETVANLAIAYGVSRTPIQRIVLGQSWSIATPTRIAERVPIDLEIRIRDLEAHLAALLPLARAAVAWWRADDATLAEAHGRLLTALADLDPVICAELEADA